MIPADLSTAGRGINGDVRITVFSEDIGKTVSNVRDPVPVGSDFFGGTAVEMHELCIIDTIREFFLKSIQCEHGFISSSNNASHYLTESVRMPIPQPRMLRIRRLYPAPINTVHDQTAIRSRSCLRA